MSILIKKLQQGGLFANSATMDLGARSLMDLVSLKGSTGGRAATPKMYSPKTNKSSNGEIKDGLVSDIDFYNKKRNSIDLGIKDLMLDGIDNDEKAEYDQLLRDKYELETSYKPKLKSLNSYFKKTKTHFDKEEAGEMPAIYNNAAFVQDKNGYSVISANKLLMNAKDYKLLTAAEVLSHRMNDVQFSGFTQLGKDATVFLDNVYGEESFTDYMNKQLGHLGYTKNKGGGFIINEDKERIAPEDITIKSNIDQIKDLISNFNGQLTSKQSSYLNSRSIYDVYNGMRSGNMPSNLTDSKKIQELVSNARGINLARSVKHAVIKDMTFETSDGPNGSGGSGKDKKYNPLAIALVKVGSEEGIIDIGKLDKSKKPVSLLWSTKSAFVDDGLKILEQGYDKDGTLDKSNYRSLKNNAVINNIKGGKGLITTVNGVELMDIVENGKDENVTTPGDANMQIVLAPIETVDGKDRVNFDNEYAAVLAEVIGKIHDAWKKEGISAFEAATDPEVKKKAEKISNDLLIKELTLKQLQPPNNLRIGIAIAFDVVYLSESGKDEYSWNVSSGDETVLDNAGADYDWFWKDTPMRTKAFVPLSTSFFSNVQSSNYFGADLERKFSASAWEAASIKTPKVSDKLDPSGLSENISLKRYREAAGSVITQKRGGKLASSEDLMKLIL